MPRLSKPLALNALTVLTTAVALAAAPTAALASGGSSGGSGGSGLNGGSGLGGSGTTATTTPAPTAAAAPVLNVTGTTSVVNGNVSLVTTKVGQTGSMLKISGTAGTAANRLVAIEYHYGAAVKWNLASLVTTTKNGAFSKRWQPATVGNLKLRAVMLPAGVTAVAAAYSKVTSLQGTATQTLPVTIFQPVVASYETNFGALDSCGTRLSSTTIGIASPTLKCGTKVTIYYNGKQMTVPVVDHGPYVTGRSYDLTYAVAKDIGMYNAGVATIGAIP